MKSEFNKSWNSSKQPRKQRKFLANAPNHIRRKLMGASLDKSLRTKYGMRNIEVRKGDEVKVMRGKFKKKQGKVGKVDVKNCRIQVNGLQRQKKDEAEEGLDFVGKARFFESEKLIASRWKNSRFAWRIGNRES
jgi:large subunit ribosomal protein L24